MEEERALAFAKNESCRSLADRILAGDAAAENELVTTYSRAVYVIAAARTRDREAARDLTQEVFIAVLKALREGQLRESGKLAAFVQGTARNVINNYFRTLARRSECNLDSVEAPTVDLVGALEAAEKRRLVRHELESFSSIDQQILLLSLVDGHSLAEVAERLNLSHDVVRARKSRMIRKIIKKFADMSQK